MRLVRTAAAALVIFAGAACEGGTEVEAVITMNDLEATWTATEFVWTNKANTSQTFDLIASGGSAVFVVTATTETSGTFVATFVVPTPQGNLNCPNVTGTLTLSDQQVSSGTGSVNFDEAHPCIPEVGVGDFTADFTLSGDQNTLTINNENADFDFPPQDGTEEEATSQVILTRS